MTPEEIPQWLFEEDPLRLEMLWRAADLTRQLYVGDEVHLRGLIEVSNICQRSCAYCGIAACAPKVERYRMTQEDILECADKALEYGFGTVVMQAGEDPGITGAWMADTIRQIKDRTGLAITLSLGERSDEELQAWREAGADRYLLRFETTDEDLYRRIHPNLPGGASDRIQQLLRMREIGFEIGTGVMVGIPGQTWETLSNDILTFQNYDMDMIGIGPYIPSPGTPLEGPLGEMLMVEAGTQQVPNDPLTTLKALALTRLVCPQTNIPSTTALATVDPSSGRANGLLRGANVIMPNLTQPKYRVLYQIYPGKAGLHETADITTAKIRAQIEGLGRRIGQGPGTSPRITQRHEV
ncbi:MAG: [FeFe] hydrogenase H-cluster radical SAM maturase HydE [Holophaga sp.]|nr:[FeFe] hydrogenase H-cluster radical SAM maturase HydE [Holophaga sp.]